MCFTELEFARSSCTCCRFDTTKKEVDGGFIDAARCHTLPRDLRIKEKLPSEAAD